MNSNWAYAYCKNIPESVLYKIEKRIKDVQISITREWSGRNILCFNRPLTSKEQLIVELIAGQYLNIIYDEA